MKSLIWGDLHLADNPPSPYRTETYRQDILDKLQASINIANELNVDCIQQLGDWFHVKAPSRTSHGLVQDVLDILSTARMPIFIVVGNHDLVMDDLKSLDRQPLGVVLRAPNVYPLSGRPKAGHPEFDILGLPYHDNPDDWNQYLTDDITPRTLICMHASIFPRSELPPYDAIAAEDLASLLPEARYFAYGHIHTPPKKGAYYQAGDAWFCNRGAISRGSLHADNLTRIPGVTLFDSEAEGCPFTSIDLPHKPASEVFRLEEHVMTQDSQSRVEEFLESLEEVAAAWITKEGIQSHILKELNVKSHSLVDKIFDAVD